MKHLLSVDDLGGRAGIEAMLDVTDTFLEVTRREIPKVPALRGKTVVSLFYEDSTRTRLSFESAAKRLSADTMAFSLGSSSVKKGESLLDTVQTIEAMGIDAIVVRHAAAGAPHRVAAWTDASVINAGDGRHEHPTQALLDAFTLRRHRGPSLDGCRIAIVGDVAELPGGAQRREGVPRTRLRGHARRPADAHARTPRRAGRCGCRTTSTTCSPTSTSCTCCAFRPSASTRRCSRRVREYAHRFGLTVERAARLKPDTLVMHPGPMNRGVEIAGEVADSARSLVTEQVANGVAVRMAVLWSLLGSGGFIV